MWNMKLFTHYHSNGDNNGYSRGSLITLPAHLCEENHDNIWKGQKQTTILLELMVERTDVLLNRVCPDGQLTLIPKIQETFLQKYSFWK